MSNFRKKAIALASVACVALTSFASCMDSKSSSSSNAGSKADSNVSENATDADGNTVANANNGNGSGSGNGSSGGDVDFENIVNDQGQVVVTPFQSGSSDDFGIPAPEVDLDSDDPVAKEPATEIVEVTEANGEKATDSAGNVVTQIVTKPADSSSENYKSKTESKYCFWIDISKDSDYVFNDQFIKVTFNLKDNIPDRDYPVRFNPDLSSVAGKTITPDKVVQGTIRVGGDIAAQNVSSESGFVVYGDNVSAKAGDTVDYYLNIKNNPGLAGILVWVYYDANAMDVESIRPAGEFANFAKTKVGSKPE
jgi:hypothetical protein